jgi:hypothetical protein
MRATNSVGLGATDGGDSRILKRMRRWWASDRDNVLCPLNGGSRVSFTTVRLILKALRRSAPAGRPGWP